MNTDRSPNPDTLPAFVADHIDQVCDRFEAAWKAGLRPRIEEHLGPAPEPGRAALLRELLMSELEWRRRGGERPAAREYEARFPTDVDVIAGVFGLEHPPDRPRPPEKPSATTKAGRDRNLLFGILALQMDFIAREALIDAMNAWVLRKSEPLGRILLDQKALTADEHQLIEALVVRHLQKHGDDPEQSLSAVGPVASIQGHLGRIADPDLRASLTAIAADQPATGDPYATRSDGGPQPAPGLRFHILRPHAKGGLGEVFVAEDVELHREVALKEILTFHAHDPRSRARFLLEAEITGRLEHPGIVPVYGLGAYDDGRPYYAMRLIKGDSLKRAITRFHTDPAAGRGPNERGLAFRRLLRRFIDACNAVAYAHSRGVIHRDIKPSNIMLGPYGETLVVDWGLAKTVGRHGGVYRTAETTLRPHATSGGAETQQGAAVGTPAYMSPEQAAGRLDLLRPTTDVYSLGATLYHLLTGRVPFEDGDLDKVQRGEVAPPRAVVASVPRALEAICLKAMAVRPEDRYASPQHLADDLEHWLADEPVAVHRERWPARVVRWGRRHRPVVAGAAALLVTAVVGLTIGTVLLTRANARTEAQRQRAEASSRIARRAVDRMLRQVGEIDLADVPQVEPVRRTLLEEAGQFYREILEADGDDPAVRREAARAHCGLGDVLALLGRHDAAESSYGRATALLSRSAPPAKDVRRDKARALHGLGVLLKQAHRFDEAERLLRRALELRKQLAAESPDDPAALQEEKDTQFHLAALLARLQGGLLEAEADLRAAVRMQRALVARDPEDPGARRKLARNLNQMGLVRWSSSPPEAEADLREAQAIQEGLVARSPTVVGYRWDLARSAINLGALRSGTRPAEAAADYEQAARLLRQLADDFPLVPDYRHELAGALTSRALLDLEFLGRPEAAQPALRDALALRTRLAHDFPERFDYRHRLAEVHRLLGDLLRRAGRYPEAEAAFHEDLRIQEGLVASFPDVPGYQSALGCAHSSLAVLLLDLDRRRAAREFLTRGMMTAVLLGRDRLVSARELLIRGIAAHRIALASHPRHRLYREHLRHDLLNLAEVHWRLGSHAAAAAVAEELPPLAPDDPELGCDTARILARCATLAAGDPKLTVPQRRIQADTYARRAVELLGQAIAKDACHREELDEPDYQPLLNRPDFQELREKIQAVSQTAAG